MINSYPTNASPSDPRSPLHSPPEVALAILYQGDRFLLQLRDDIPTILYPGCWALFGGHLEQGESPLQAVKREIWEEIGFKMTDPVYFRPYSDQFAIRHVFSHPLTVPLADLNLQEGWDFALISLDDIDQGQAYSPQAQAVKPFGDRHRTILLDFLDAQR
ncbi:MAG: NUDIX hydrolase [Synechocystis sp.]|nr:NUDIX hydrolase [Synechocystis sp.]